MHGKRILAGLVGAGAFFIVSGAPSVSLAQSDSATSYPARPIRLIVPFAPGGPNDVLARYVGEKLARRIGQQVVPDNRPGGGTVIGTQLAAKASPDGHTLLMVSVSTAVNPTLKKALPYDTLKDFVPVIQLAASPNVLVVNASVPVKSVKELIALAKSKPGEIAYGSGGTGTATHLAGELFCVSAGVKMIHVPYKGTGPALVDLLGGRIAWMFGPIVPMTPQLKAGSLRALGVSSLKRSPVLPDVPAVAETLPGFEATSFYGIFAPAGTPKAVVSKLNAEIAALLRTPDTREYLESLGAEIVADTPEEFRARFVAEVNKWAKLIKEIGIEPQ